MTRTVARRLKSRRARLVCASSAAALVWSLATAAAALPTGGVVYDSTPGSPTTFTPGSGTLDINQGGDRVVIDWSTFDIASGETVTFNQADASWIAFNRVDPSAFTTIDGNINAVGQVWLFSPGGLLFGPNAQVNTGSFLGSTAQLLDPDATAALSTNTVNLSALTTNNASTLTVANGAQITAASGFVVLMGETIVQNGQIVSNNDAVFFGVAEQGTVTFTATASDAQLTDATVSSVPGRGRPSMTQGSTGVVEAATWVGISTPAYTEDGFGAVINLAGSIEATGVKPGTGDSIIIVSEENGDVELLGEGVSVDTTNATITASDGVYVALDQATIGSLTSNGFFATTAATTVVGTLDAGSGDATILGGGPVDVSGSVSASGTVELTSFAGDVTVSGSVTASNIQIEAYSLVDISGSLDGTFIDVESTDGDVLIQGTGYLHSSGSGAPGIVIAAATDLTVEAGAQVLANDDIDLTSDGTMTLDGYLHGLEVDALSDGQMDIGGDLYGDAYVTLETTTGDLLMHTGASIDTNGFGGGVPVRLTSGGSLTIDTGVTVDSYDDMAIRADGGDLTIDGSIYGDRVDLDASGDLTIGYTGYFYINQFAADAVGDILIDGFIDAPTTLFATSSGGDVTIGANGYLSSFSVGLVAADQLTTVAGSSIDGDGGVGTLSFTANGVDGADSAMELSGDIDGQNIQIIAGAGSVTIHDGTITAANDVNTYIAGDFTTEAGSLIDATGDVSIDVPGDIAIAGEIRGDTIDLDGDVIDAGAGDLVVDTSLTVNGNDVTLGGVSGNTVQIDVTAVDSITLEDDLWSTAYSDITLETTGVGSQIDIGAQIYASTISAISDGDITLQATADVNVRTYVNTNPGDTSASFTAYGDLTLVAGSELDAREDVQLTTNGPGGVMTVDGSVRGANIDLQAVGDIAIGGSLSASDLFNAPGLVDIESTGSGAVIDIDGSIDADNVNVVSAGDINQLGGTITVESRFDAYAEGEFNTSAGALITSAVGYDAVIDVIANGDIHLAGDVIAYDVIFAGHGDLIEVSGLLSGTDRVSIYNDSGDIHLTSTAEIYAGQPVANPYPVVYIGASESILTDAGSYIHTAAGYSGAYVNMHSNGPTGTFDLSGDITSSNIYLGSRNGDVDVILRDGDFVATEYIFIVSSGDLTTGANTTITTDGNIYLEADNLIDLSGDISGDYVSIVADGDIHQQAGTITVQDGGFYSYSAYDTTTDAGAVITNAIGSDNAVIEIFAGYSLDLGGAIYGYEVFLDSVGPMILISGSIYATDFIFIYNDTGSLHLTGTADLQAGTPVVSSYSSIYLGAYGSVRVDAGAQITAGVGQAGSYVSLFANGPTGYLDMSGDIASGGIYMGSRSGDVDVTVNGSLDADGDVSVVSSGDLTMGAGSSIIAGDYVYLYGQASIDLGGDIYAYQAQIISDGDVTQSAGTITVDDGGLYIYALYDVTTEAGALIETTIDGGGAIIYLNAGDDLTVGGDIDGGYFVNLNSEARDGDSLVTISGSIYSTDFIIVYNDYGDIHLTSTAELFAGQPTVFGEPGIWIAAEGSILSDAGSYIHTYPGYADGYVHIEVNDVTGSIDLSSDITSENITIEAPFGVVDIYLRGGTITTDNDLYIDSNGVLLVGANVYADYVTLQAVGDLTVSGDIVANDGVSVISTGGDVYIDGFIEGYASSGTAILVSAEGDLTIAAGGDLEAYGDLVLQTTGNTGVLEVSGDILGDNVYLYAQGGILVGATADIYAYDRLSLLSDDGVGGATVADIQIDGIMDGNGVSIINRNDGDVIFGATADVSSYYYYCVSCRIEPGDQTALLGADGDIYIYSANSVITVAGSSIDATTGMGADKGLITIVANGPDIGASITTAAIDLSGDINAYNVVLTANNGSIRQRDGTITFTEDFTADAELNFIQDGGGVIDGLNGTDFGNVNVYANEDILLLGVIAGYYVDLTTTGTVPGSEIQIAGEVYASDDITITNLNGGIQVHATGVIHTGTPYETSYGDIDLIANGLISTAAGSQIYTDAAFGTGSEISIHSSIASGLGVDLAGDITTAGDVEIMTTLNGDIRITGGTIDAGDDVDIRSQNQIDITGGAILAGNAVLIYADADILAAGDIDADYIGVGTYSGEGGGVYGSVIRIEGELTAQTDVSIRNRVGGVEIGAGAVVHGNASGLADGGPSAVDIYGYSILTEAGSLITVGDGINPPVGQIDIQAYDDFAGPGPAIDLSGDIEADQLFIDVGANNDMRVRAGSIDAIADLNLNIDGYFIVDDPASIATDGDFYAYSQGGMTIRGDLTADRMFLRDSSGADLVIGGTLSAAEDINIVSFNDDVRLEATAALIADTDNSTSGQDYNGVFLSAEGQVTSAAGSTIRVGPTGAPTGDVHISAHGGDLGGFSSIDLSGDIEAEHLYLYTEVASIRLRDGDITLEEDLYIDSPRGFIMDAGATIFTDGAVDIRAEYQLTALGTITSGEYISLSSVGVIGGGMTVGGYLYAEGDVTLASADPDADIVLAGPTIIADTDNNGAGEIDIDSAGAVNAPGNGLLQVGDGSGAPTGNVTIHAGGGDGANNAAIDLNIDITAVTLTLDADAGSIHIGPGADFILADDFTVDSVLDFDMDYGADITVAGDIDITAHRALTVDGHLDADNDITLLLASPGGGDLGIGGLITAGGDVDIRALAGDIIVGGGEIYADGGLVIASAGAFTSDDKSVIEAGGDLSISAAEMDVDGDLTALGDVKLTVNTSGGFGYSYFTAGPGDMVVSGNVTANGSVYLENFDGGDVYLDATAQVLANADDLGTGDLVSIFAYDQVISAAGSTIAVGTGAVASGDVSITAYGADNANYSAIDLSGDINASVLTLETTDGSIALNEGTFNGYNGVQIDSAGAFLLDDAAVVNTNEDFVLNADAGITIDGRIDAGFRVFITNDLGGSGDITISGDIYADAEMIIHNYGAAGDVILNGATLVSDDDNYGAGQVEIVASGQVHAYGGGLISAGPAGSPTNLVSITAQGADGGGLSAIDLDIDISADTLELNSDASIDIAGGTINVVNDLSIEAYLDFTMGDPAVINGQGDVSIVAGRGMGIDGDIFAGGDVYLLLDSDFFNFFTAGPGDMTVGGTVEADGSVSIVNAEGGDIYLEAGAAIRADADSSSGGDAVEITADGQVISAAGSSILVGAAGAPTGDVDINAYGGDNANYSAIDLASDIEAINLSIDADAGSVNLAGGQIEASGDIYVEADLDIFLDEPANLYAGGDVDISGGRTFIVDGSIHADGDVTLLLEGPGAQDMTIDRLIAAGGDIDIRNLGDGLLSFGDQTALFSGEDIVIQAYGDLSMDGFFDSAGFFSAQSLQDLDFSGSLQAGTGASFTSTGDMTITGDAIAEGFNSLALISDGDLYFDGQFQAGGDISVFADNMVVNGSLQALDDVGLTAYGGETGAGDIVIGGDITTGDDIIIYADDDFTLASTGSLTADTDAGGDAALIRIEAGGQVITQDGSTMHVGSPTLRTGEIYIYGLAYDGEGGPAIELSGEMDAETINVEAYNGSIVVSGSIQADESIQLVAYYYFVLEDGGQIWGAMDRAIEDDLADGPILSDESPGVGIVARDVSIDGEIRSGTATDDATIVIAAHYVDGDVTVGGADNAELGQGFVLSNAEFQNLYADRIVIISGEGEPFGSGYDLHIADLDINAANTSEVWFGTSENLFVNGAVTTSAPGEVDLHLGFTILTDSLLVDPGNPGGLQPGEMLVNFIPDNVFISGSMGTVENPFGSVTMIVQGDILMGSVAFIDAAAADPEFDAAEASENFDPPSEGHVFIATDQLQMAAGDRILQQDTDTGTGYGGLVLGLPQPGFELIFSPDQLQGQLIGGTGGWTADFDAGPSRIELFGSFNGTPHAIDGRDAANVANLLDPDILLGDYYFNTCLFGSSECSAGDETPPFIDPTPPVHPDPTVIPGVDEVLSFFTSFPFQEPDDEEDEDEVEGEPVTGSGNEDLWTIKPTQGVRP